MAASWDFESCLPSVSGGKVSTVAGVRSANQCPRQQGVEIQSAQHLRHFTERVSKKAAQRSVVITGVTPWMSNVGPRS